MTPPRSPANHPPTDVADLLLAAVTLLPIDGGLVLLDSFSAHNPDFFDSIVELFGATEEAHVRAEVKRAKQRATALRALDVPGVRVLGGSAFGAEQARASHRIAFTMAPIVSRDGRTGLLVFQIETASRRSAIAVDHWVLLRKNNAGEWKRAPIPAPLRQVLHLTEETGG